MSEFEAAVSGDVARLNELIRIIYTAKSEGQLLVEHEPDGTGHCRRCRSVGCSLYNAAVAAQTIRAKHAARFEQAKKLGGSAT